VLPPNHVEVSSLREYTKVPLCECRDVPDEASAMGRVAAEAVKVMREVKDAPFFLAVGFWKPHAPFNAPKKYSDLYRPQRAAHAEPRAARGRTGAGLSSEHGDPRPGEGLAKAAHAGAGRDHAARLLANISYLDAQLGKVLDALEQNGLMDKTVDHLRGRSWLPRRRARPVGETSNFEYDARVPFFIRDPGSA